jgi:hypothetical protein
VPKIKVAGILIKAVNKPAKATPPEAAPELFFEIMPAVANTPDQQNPEETPKIIKKEKTFNKNTHAEHNNNGDNKSSKLRIKSSNKSKKARNSSK